MEEKSYQTLEDKRGELVELPLESLVVSEMNVRCAFVDQEHVRTLSAMMKEYGFQKERAIRVNVILDASGKVLYRRVIAGAHRYYAAKHAGLTNIYCHLYYNLSEDEECLLDQIDNKLDEKRKTVSFLDESEHYKFLRDIKGWSGRQIARSKQVDRKTVDRRIKIAELPPEVKVLIRGGEHVPHLKERHLYEILKLNVPAHIILIIKEIVERGSGEEEGAEGVSERRNEQSPMKQREVEARVKELLEMESRGKVSPKVMELLQEAEQAEQAEAEAEEEEEEAEQQARCLEGETGSRERPEPPQLPPLLALKVQQETAMEMSEEERAAMERQEEQQRREQEEQMRGEQDEWLIEVETLGKPSKKRTTEEMKFDVVPRWLGHSSLRWTLASDWDLFEQLIKFDLRYLRGGEPKGDGEGYFFIEGKESGPGGSYKYLAQLTAIKTVGTVQKKLRSLCKKGYIEMRQLNLPRYPRFRIVWEKVKKVYDKEAWGIPYQEGGLEGLPGTFSGTLHPTPEHTIYVIDGSLTKDHIHAFEDVLGQLETLGVSQKLQKKLLAEHPFWSLRDALKEYQRAERTAPQKANGTGKQRPLDVLLGFLKGRTPQN